MVSPWYFLNKFSVQVKKLDKQQLRAWLLVPILEIISMYVLLGCVPLNPIVWCYVWHYLWLNVMINKVVLLLSKIMVTLILGHYHMVHEMHSMWFMWFNHRRYKSQVLCKLRILVHNRWWKWAFHLRRQ